MDDHSSGPAVTGGIKLPTRASRAEASLRRYPCGPAPREAPIRHCSGWGLPCRSCCQVRGGLLPHRFTLALHAGRSRSLWRFPWGCPRRALPGTLASWSPDFPRAPCRTRGHPAFRARRAYAVAPPPSTRLMASRQPARGWRDGPGRPAGWRSRRSPRCARPPSPPAGRPEDGRCAGRG